MSESTDHTPDDGVMERYIQREILKAAVMRQIFDGITGHVLDMRTSVLIDGTCDGIPVMSVMAAEVWDVSADIFRAHITDMTVIDGRDLWPAKKAKDTKLPSPHSLI